MTQYRLQRWWITKGWTTIETSKDKDKIIRSFDGYKVQIIDGSFRVKAGKRVIAERKGSLQKKYEDKRERWARYPLATEAIKTKTYKKKLKLYMKKGDSRAYANEKAINDAIKVLRRQRMKTLRTEGQTGRTTPSRRVSR